MTFRLVDITTTATIRPEILDRCLSSFRKNLFVGRDNMYYRLILNIDTVGDVDSASRTDVWVVARNHFPIAYVSAPEKANFAAAFKRVWSRATGDWVFHLEDDWELTSSVDLEKLISILERHDDLAGIRLPAFHARKDGMKNWSKWFKWNGEFYEPPAGEKWLGFCGHPTLFKGEFVRRCAPLIDVSKNPEKQFNHRRAGNVKLHREFMKWRFGVYGVPGDPPTPPMVVDIGRNWMMEHGLRKKGVKAFFTEWESASGERAV